MCPFLFGAQPRQPNSTLPEEALRPARPSEGARAWGWGAPRCASPCTCVNVKLSLPGSSLPSVCRCVYQQPERWILGHSRLAGSPQAQGNRWPPVSAEGPARCRDAGGTTGKPPVLCSPPHRRGTPSCSVSTSLKRLRNSSCWLRRRTSCTLSKEGRGFRLPGGRHSGMSPVPASLQGRGTCFCQRAIWILQWYLWAKHNYQLMLLWKEPCSSGYPALPIKNFFPLPNAWGSREMKKLEITG